MVDEEEVREQWKEHFEELYGPVSERVSQHTLCSEVPVDGELEIMQEEVRRGARMVKVRKAAWHLWHYVRDVESWWRNGGTVADRAL